LSTQRGEVVETDWARSAVATVRPSSILRQVTSEDRRREMGSFVSDLMVVARVLRRA
jgi:hypothetical protein